MSFDPKKYFKKKAKKKLKKGVHFSISIDIRKVENFFKKLFTRRKKKNDKDRDK